MPCFTSLPPGFSLRSQAVVLACEDGRRLYPLTQDCPAPLLPVLNKPLLHYQLELLEKAGYTGATRSTAKMPRRVDDQYCYVPYGWRGGPVGARCPPVVVGCVARTSEGIKVGGMYLRTPPRVATPHTYRQRQPSGEQAPFRWFRLSLCCPCTAPGRIVSLLSQSREVVGRGEKIKIYTSQDTAVLCVTSL